MARVQPMTANPELRFRVVGRPQPGGSKRGFPIRRNGELTGRVAITDDNPAAKDWKGLVIAAAMSELDGISAMAFWTGPLDVELTFLLARPKGHYGSGRNELHVRSAAPTYPAVKPDVSKLARPTIDALTGVLWRDDAQIVTERHAKRYEEPAGCWVSVTRLGA